MKKSYGVWFKILACCFIVVAVVCVAMALMLAHVDGEDGADGKDGITILGVEKTTDGNVDTYTVNYSDGTAYSFTVTNAGKGDEGVGISTISKTSSSGNADTYTIYLTDGSEYTFDVTNGADGNDGAGILDIAVDDGYIDDGTFAASGDTGTLITITLDDAGATSYTFFVPDGGTGGKGDTGVGIKEIKQTAASADGLTVTYTIYYTDDTETTYTVENGNYITDVSVTNSEADSEYVFTFTLKDGSTITDNVTYTPYITDVDVNDDGDIVLTYSNSTASNTVTRTAGNIKGIENIVQEGRYVYIVSTDGTDNTENYSGSLSINSYAYSIDLCCSHGWTNIDDLDPTTKTSLGLANITVGCETVGVTYYYCSDCGAIKTVITSATGHNYGSPVWTWASDYSYATATFTCANNNSHTEILIANVTSQVATAATCTADGSITYTATAYLNGTAYTNVVDNVTIPATGHNYTAEWQWTGNETDGYTAAEITLTCANDGTHSGTYAATITNSVVKAATCTLEGSTAYTATYTYGGVEYTDTKTVTTSATGHSYACSNYVTLGDTGSATIAAVRCDDCGEYEIVELTSLQFTAYNANGNAVAVASSVNTSGNTASLASARLTSGSADTVAYYVVSRGTYTGADIIIPATYNGKPVYYVDDFSDSNYSGDVSVSIGTQTITLTYSALNSITIPNGVLEIKASAFANCDSLTTVTVPDTVTTIGANAFSGCSGLTSITLPFAGHNADGSYLDSSELTFAYIFGTIPTGLATVEITGGGTDNNTRITATAFANCTTLTSMVVGDYITEIVEGAFSGCSNLTSITLPFVGGSAGATEADETTLFGYIFGKDYYSGGTLISQEKPEGNVYADYYIPAGLANVTITGAGNSTILFGALNSCTIINTVILGEEVITIDDYAFMACTGLTSLTLNEGLLHINQYAFGYCKFSSLAIPSSVTSIGWAAFYNCSNLKNVYISDLTAWCNIDFYVNGTSYSKYTSPLYDGADFYVNEEKITDLVIPDDVTSIGACAFVGAKFTSITISNELTIGNYAFALCANLSKVTIEKAVTINLQAFYNAKISGGVYIKDLSEWCANVYVGEDSGSFYQYSNPLRVTGNLYLNNELVTSLVIPDSISSINYLAFAYCTSITSISIPSSVTSIGSFAFYSCKLATITVDNGSAYFKAVDNVLYSKDGKQLILYAAAKTDTTFTVDNTVEVINGAAFSYCTNLTSVSLGSSVTTIGIFAFYYCSNLVSINIPSSVTKIARAAFNGCSSLSTVTFSDTSDWYYTSSSDYTGGSLLTSTYLDDTSTAATYLTSTYVAYYWYKS